MKPTSTLSGLHLKFAEKTWNETFQLVRRCMDKSRDQSKPCEPLVRTLERLQEVFNVSSMNTMKSRLEVIAKQLGLGFHVAEAACYLTADLFYLEVVLLACGGVEEVKVAPHGGSPVPSEAFLQLLRSKHFADFSTKLAGLFTQYNVPGDNEMKLKLFTSLQCLGKDLEQISLLPRASKDSDSKADVINGGRLGCLMPGKEDCPLTIQFYISPADELNTSDSQAVVQAAHVTVGASDVTHKLQVASVIPQPVQLDQQGCPVCLPLSEGPYEALPACFLLKLQPAIPVNASFINKLSQITDVAIADVDLQWAPLPKLLMRRSSANSHEEVTDEQDAVFTVPLADGATHRYILPGAAWEAPAHRGAVLDSVPFTHPAHVPAMLELLRHQCAINTLLRSCVAPRSATPGLVGELLHEVRPESETSFSVTFRRPGADSLAVLLVNVCDSLQISCTLFGAGSGGDPSLDEYVSGVMTRCRSIPASLRTLHSKLEEIASASRSPDCPMDEEAPSSVAADDPGSTLTTIPQSASVPDDDDNGGVTVSGSAICALSVAKSELHPEINSSPVVGPYPFTPVGVLPPWMTNNGQLSELI